MNNDYSFLALSQLEDINKETAKINYFSVLQN